MLICYGKPKKLFFSELQDLALFERNSSAPGSFQKEEEEALPRNRRRLLRSEAGAAAGELLSTTMGR